MATKTARSKERRTKDEAKADGPSEETPGYLLYILFFVVACVSASMYMQYGLPEIQQLREVGDIDAADYTLNPKTTDPSTTSTKAEALPISSFEDSPQSTSSPKTVAVSVGDNNINPTPARDDAVLNGPTFVPTGQALEGHRRHYMDLFETSPTFANLTLDWRLAADKQIQGLSTLQQLEARVASTEPPSLPELTLMHDITMSSLAVSLTEPTSWLAAPTNIEYFSPDVRDMPKDEFQAFVMRVDKEEGQMVVWGDIHGSFSGLTSTLRRLATGDNACLDSETLLLRDGCRFLVLGDFVDRGERSVEVMFVLMLLRAVNGHKMMFIRGNHEDWNMCARYGLAHEVVAKYPNDREYVLGRLLRLFQMFPVGAYIGSPQPTERHYLQFSHGVFEFGYLPKELLAAPVQGEFLYEPLAVINRTKTMKALGENDPDMHARIKKKCESDKRIAAEFTGEFQPYGPSQPRTLGLCWTDLLVKPVTAPMDDFYFVAGRGTAYGLPLLHNLFRLSSTKDVAELHGIVRGHQHNNAAGPMLTRLVTSFGFVDAYGEGKGANPMCPESGGPRRDNGNGEFFICTTISASESNLDFNYNSYLLIHTSPEWKDWLIEHHWKPADNSHDAWTSCPHGPKARSDPASGG